MNFIKRLYYKWKYRKIKFAGAIEIGANIVKYHMEGDIRVIDDMDIYEVSLISLNKKDDEK